MTTKKQFEEAYKKFPLCKSERFFIKYISLHNLQNNKLLSILIPIFLILPFLAEVLIYFLFNSNVPKIWKIFPNSVYILILLFGSIYWFYTWNKKRKRFENIRKELGIGKKELDNIVNMYFYHIYPTTDKYIKYNAK